MKHVVHWELVIWSCQLSLDTNSAGVLQNWERVLKIIIKLMWVIWLFRSRSFLATIADFATRDNIRYFITFQKNKILRTLFSQDQLSFLVATCKKNPIIMLLIFQKGFSWSYGVWIFMWDQRRHGRIHDFPGEGQGSQGEQKYYCQKWRICWTFSMFYPHR